MKRVIDDKDGYGPNGKQYIEHVEVPQKILAAYRYIFFDMVNIKGIKTLSIIFRLLVKQKSFYDSNLEMN